MTYCKAYDLVLHSCLQKSIGVAVNLRSYLTHHWNTELMAGNQRFGNSKTKRGIFQGNSLSTILFLLVMIPLTLALRQKKASYKLKKENQLLFMDDLKLFAKVKIKYMAQYIQ